MLILKRIEIETDLDSTREMEFISVENFWIDIRDYLETYIFYTIRLVLNVAFTIRFHILIYVSFMSFRVRAKIQSALADCVIFQLENITHVTIFVLLQGQFWRFLYKIV